MPEYDPDRIPILDDVIEDKGPNIPPIEDEDIATAAITADASVEGDNGRNEDNLDLFTAEPVKLIDIVETEIIAEPSLLDNTTEDETELYIADIDELDKSIVDEQITAGRDDDEPGSETTSIVFDATDNTTDDAVDVINEDDFSAVVSEPVDPEPVESALIDYHGEQSDTDNAATSPDFNEDENIETVNSVSNENSAPQEAVKTLYPGQLHQISLQPLVNDIVRQLMPDLEQQLRFLVQQALEDRLPEEILKKEE